MKQLKKYEILCLFSILICSCDYKFSLQKRKYTKGFFIASSTNKNNFEKYTNEISYTKKKEPKDILDIEVVKGNLPHKTDCKLLLNSIFEPPTLNKHYIPNGKINKNKQFFLSVNNKKKSQKKDQKNKDGILEVFENIYLAYLFILALIALAYISFLIFSFYPFLQALLIILVIIIALVLLAGLGKALRTGF